MNYYNYSGIPLSAEVREFLAENDKELKRQQNRDYQHGVSCHAFDVEERSPGDTGRATCDPIYAVTRARSLSAEKAFFRQGSVHLPVHFPGVILFGSWILTDMKSVSG